MTSQHTFPLTDLQAGYLVGASQLIELGGFRPTMYFEFDMVGLDPIRAQDAVNRLIRRHEHLRTVVVAEGAQRVLDPSEVTPVQLPVIDLVGMGGPAQEAATAQVRERMCEAGPDPTGWPLFEIVLHRLRPHRFRVHFAMSLLLLDSHSTYQLIDEWWDLYRDPAGGPTTAPRTFRESLLSMVAEEDSEAYRTHWRYWEERLDTLPEAPRLPLAGPLANIGPVRLTRRACHLTGERWRRLCAHARRNRVLPNTAMLHVFAETLGAWAAAPHFLLNVLHQTWATSRPHEAGVVGQFSSTLPLEVDLRGSGDFWARAQRLQRQLWRDMPHSDVSAVRVTRALAARRGWTSRAALPYVFNSMLRPERPEQAPRRPTCRVVTSNLRTPQVLIDNQLRDEAGGVTCVWDVVDDAFPPGLPDIMFDAYRQLLEGLADSPEAAPDPVPADHRRTIARDNPAAGPPPAGRLEDGFLRRATGQPDAPAVVTAHRSLTYGELEATSRAVALWLRERDVGRGDVVPVVMAKGWEQVVAVLGVLRAGAAYCPVDAGLPAERIRHLVDECAAAVVLGQSHRTPDLGLDHLYVDRVEPAATALPLTEGDPADLAYIIYTSGSTGRPKGVMIEHRAALNTVLEVNERIALAPADRVFGISSLSFDLSVWDVFGTLAAGAALTIPEATARPDPIGWATAATSYGVTVWNSVPALAEMLVEVAEQRPDGGHPPIRAFLLSGDWVPMSLPDRLRRRWPQTRVVAMGGATEASIWSNAYEVGRVDPGWRSIPYGRPLRDQTMRVLDHRLDVRPQWAEGRIYIGGAGLAQGYWRDEEHTAERFVRHPETGERLYWTGDLGRYWPDGTIEFLGREDRQTKIQGFRVEPGEVESVIRELPGVRDCAVSAEPAPGGQRRLVAVVAAPDGPPPDSAAVADHLRARLPHYMVPGQIHVVDRMPLSANGKVDVARALAGLAAPAAAPTGHGADSPLARRLDDLWAELLQVPVVGPDSDFFALGGNSLLALRLVNRLRTDLGVDLPFGHIFEAPTLGALAARIQDGRPSTTCAVELSRSGSGPRLVLFHPVGGSVASYLGLAGAWAGPVRAFQSRALAIGHGDAEPNAFDPDLETMAAGYRDELQRSEPDGPYLLGGWSMGGVLAYEVAAQLAEQGHEAHVFMIDSDVENLRVPDSPAALHLEFLTDLAGGRLPAEVAAAVRRAGAGDLARTARDAAVAAGLLPAGSDVAGYERLAGVHAHNLRILAAHRPSKSDVHALLIVAGAVDRPDPLPAWQAACPDVEVDVWPYDHYSIVTGDRPAAIVRRVRSWITGLSGRARRGTAG
ncbi:non-ribosomal peptide synthetase [Micromonospora sp. SL1-18]|uniref:non-ribosomal peptide synthetase n=1 Tax=Micromonospora sp. SL1-18 TaxID=3399128 RepID=UPI003A4D2D55